MWTLAVIYKGYVAHLVLPRKWVTQSFPGWYAPAALAAGSGDSPIFLGFLPDFFQIPSSFFRFPPSFGSFKVFPVWYAAAPAAVAAGSVSSPAPNRQLSDRGGDPGSS